MIEAAELQEYAAARAAVETLIYDIEDTIGDVRSRLEDDARTHLGDVQDAVLIPLSAIIDAATWPGPYDDQADEAEWSAVYRLARETAEAVAEQQFDVATVADRAMQETAALVSDFLPSTSEVFSRIAEIFGSLIDGLLSSLSESSDFWTSAASVIQRELSEEREGAGSWLGDVLRSLMGVINANIRNQTELLDRLARSSSTSPQPSSDSVSDYIASVRNQPQVIQNLTNSVLFVLGSWQLLSARIAGPASVLQQGSLADVKPTPLSPSALVNMLRMRIIGEEWAQNHAERSGLSSELFELLRRADERLLDTQPILELWRRSGSDSVLDELYRLGYSQESVAALRTIALATATPSDVVRFLVRDVFDPDAIARGQLDADFDKKYNEEAFRKAGVTRELALQLWMAHWQLPSPTQGYQMLHRNVLTMDELRELIKQADYAPGYVDKLIAISYNTPGRIDVRRMYETGIITTDDELESYYKAMGYSPEHAVVLRNFTKKLKEIADEGKADRRFGRIATEIVRSFVVGNMSELQARESLGLLGFSEERATLRITEAEYARQRERADTIRDAIGRQYVRGHLSQEQAREKLAGYAFDEAEVNYLLDGWNIERELREDTEAERAQKDLSKSEIIAAYTDGLLDRQAAADNLVRLGYDQSESGTLLALADAKEARADAKAIEASARTQYLNRRVGAPEARAILEGIGYTPTRIAALLSRWTVELEERRPDISPSQMERMLMHATISLGEVEERLRARGYSDDDVEALITLYGANVSLEAEKLRVQSELAERREARLTRQGDRRLDLTERGQDIGVSRFNAAQENLQQRFEQGIESRQALQSERLDHQRGLQNDRLAAQAERDANALLASRERQDKQIEAQLTRLLLQIDAADKRAAEANAARDAAMAQRERLAQDARVARDASEQRRLEAQAASQQRNIDAATRRADEANRLRQALQDQRESFQVELAQIRDEMQQLRDIRQEAARVRDMARQEGSRVRQETRAQARRDITSSEAAAMQSQVQSIQLQQASAVAEVNARFAALQARITDDRTRQALERRAEAERALASATPATTFLDTML